MSSRSSSIRALIFVKSAIIPLQLRWRRVLLNVF